MLGSCLLGVLFVVSGLVKFLAEGLFLIFAVGFGGGFVFED